MLVNDISFINPTNWLYHKTIGELEINNYKFINAA